jgi:hypothetical protein
MIRIKDITGQKFGKLTVISRASPSTGKQPRARWLCLCDCGNTVITYDDSLKSGKAKTCGKCPKFKDMTNKRFGRLLVIKPSTYNIKQRCWYWECNCDCGNICIVNGCSLRNGDTQSCGCFKVDCIKNRFTTHGKSNSDLIHVHAAIKQRCNNPKNKEYKNYGGRGITICPEWENFEIFYKWAIDNEYAKGLTIDRIDNDGSYEPNNCRWTTCKEQSNNQRRNRLITFEGKTLTLTQWASLKEIKLSTLVSRLDYLKWSIEKALTTPVQKQNRNCN